VQIVMVATVPGAARTSASAGAVIARKQIMTAAKLE